MSYYMAKMTWQVPILVNWTKNWWRLEEETMGFPTKSRAVWREVKVICVNTNMKKNTNKKSNSEKKTEMTSLGTVKTSSWLLLDKTKLFRRCSLKRMVCRTNSSKWNTSTIVLLNPVRLVQILTSKS